MQHVSILGTRGSAPTVDPACSIYGGNTQCAVLTRAGDALIFDAGTGIFAAAQLRKRLGCEGDVHILLSHYHMDHLMGLPMCPILWEKGRHVHLYGMPFEGMSCKECLTSIFSPPLWPVSLDALPSRLFYHTVNAGDRFKAGGFDVHATALNHPDGALGFRVVSEDKIFCYLFDHEEETQQESTLRDFIKDCNLLLCDAPHIAQTYPEQRGFGHSSAEAMLALAQRCGVRRVVFSHHLHGATDMQLDTIARELSACYPDAAISYAKEGEVYEL